MTCFFDAAHGHATHEITWSPQWGAPRPIRCCAACAQRWTDHLQGRGGYPQPGYPQAGYPQPGYPQPGYPQPGYSQPVYPQHGHPQPGGYGYPEEHRRHEYGLGTVAAAGAAGFVGGMIVGEMLDDDHHEHEYVEVEHIEVVEHVVVEEDVDYGGDW